jgi:hypothetical protein
MVWNWPNFEEFYFKPELDLGDVGFFIRLG